MRNKLALLLLFLPLLGFAQTYTYSALARLAVSGKNPDKSTGFLTIDPAGNLYGLANDGDYPACPTDCAGYVFKVTPKGVLSTLYSFGTAPTDGTGPKGALIRDSAGNLYGETQAAGANNFGTIFRLTPTGKETTLYNLQSNTFDFHTYLARDSAGDIYGYDASSPFLSVFRLASGGTYSELHNFCSLANCTDGSYPVGGPIIHKTTGSLYGVTALGGEFGFGTVFELGKDGTYSVLYNFTGKSDGGFPEDKLTQDNAGNVYGTTVDGGASPGSGTVFEIDSTGVFSVLHGFCAGTGCAFEPAGPVILDTAGNLYGITAGGGTKSGGVVYQITKSGVYTVLYNANSSTQLGNGLVIDKSGNLYGVTHGGSTHNATIYKLTRSN